MAGAYSNVSCGSDFLGVRGHTDICGKDDIWNLPLVLVTNDDGIDSDGLWAAVRALLPLAEICVAAPDRQWSGGGRSMPPHVTGKIVDRSRVIDGVPVSAYAVDGSPALAVQHGVLELSPRRPALVVSGINFGFNLGD